MRLENYTTSEFLESDTTDEEGVWGEDNIVISSDVLPGYRDSSESEDEAVLADSQVANLESGNLE